MEAMDVVDVAGASTSEAVPFVPRLSAALESFSAFVDEEDEHQQTSSSQQKQKQPSEIDEEEDVDDELVFDADDLHPYLLVKRKMMEMVEKRSKSELDQELKALEHVAREFAVLAQDRVSRDLLDTASLSLLEIFQSAGSSTPGPVEVEHLNCSFGPHDVALRKRASAAVESIRALLAKNFTASLSEAPSLLSTRIVWKHRKKTEKKHRKGKGGFDRLDSRGALDEAPAKKTRPARSSAKQGRDIFGRHVLVRTPMELPKINFEKLGASWKNKSFLEEERDSPDSELANGQKSSSPVSENQIGRNSGNEGEFNLLTLLTELSKTSQDIESMLQPLFALLEASRESEDLQNELVDLLGFDRLELLMRVLENRERLVEEYQASSSLPVQNLLKKHNGFEQEQLLPKKQKAPPGQQILVQSEHERLLMKDIRKQEKKLAKNEKATGRTSDLINIEDVRRKELELSASQSDSLFKQETAEAVVNYMAAMSKCPFVFDAMQESNKLSVIIGANKVVLPEGMKRKQKGYYEEIILPPSSGAPVNVGRDKIQIKDLDDICKVAFSGATELNRIQTVVFEKAYRDTENLLICAPTGAGKTNIAMLTVLRVIKDNVENGVINKNDFKVIYVAPMKALAGEMVRNFGKRLSGLGISVRELTGDIQMTKAEILKTQMIVTTPEKWDVVTRKSTGDISFTKLVKLLIIDEIHLLHDDRGPVIETLVARTLRQVEISQQRVRIVALSATLPNYRDVAHFLHVNPEKGLFFFDGRFRPVPLGQTFIGVKTASNSYTQSIEMDRVCYDKVLEFVKEEQQVLVFVHARNATGRLASTLKDMATEKGHWEYFLPQDSKAYGLAQNAVGKSRNRQLQELFPSGFGIHHAGMLRQDRNLVERLFSEGHIRVLVCTSTLAWGVNLPAHAVIIRGTEVYVNGEFVDLGILDVQQIFGRAGRPQYDKTGHGIILTTHDKLSRYLSLLTRQMPIESQFMKSLIDNLNAEIVLGTVSNMEEAITWLSFTYFYVRMLLNPLAYGISAKQKELDPDLFHTRRKLLDAAAMKLEQYEMIRYDPKNGSFFSTDLGRTASHYYVKSDTIETLLHGDGALKMTDCMGVENVLAVISGASEFTQLKLREEEQEELDDLVRNSCVQILGGAGGENVMGKVNILLQAKLSRFPITCFSLVSDSNYVAQNAGRIVRALFEIALRKSWAEAAGNLLEVSKGIEKEMWPWDHPFRQYPWDMIRRETIEKLESRKIDIRRLREDFSAKDIASIVREDGQKIKELALKFPMLEIEASVRPITRSILQISLEIVGDFIWDDRLHGKGTLAFWIWMQNPEDNVLYHYEYFLLHKKQVRSHEAQKLTFTIPITENKLPSQYLIRWSSDRFLAATSEIPVSFQHLMLPQQHRPHTDLLNLRPLPVAALKDTWLEAVYNFEYFNAVQTQIFHSLYHTHNNVLLGAPTGSGKTVAAELAIFRMFREQQGGKCVYIAPLKALVRERMKDWKVRLGEKLGCKLVELTGDFTPDVAAISSADVIVTTPEKWDGISRSWQNRRYVKDVALIIIDEIHLLGEERGPVLEVIVARTNFMVASTRNPVRVVGLSTALANAGDVADWLGIKEIGLYNFRPTVRPVPMTIHMAGFSGQHYCPRMASMNKPAFQAIQSYSEGKPVLIFVSSRRQTRLTALDLIALVAMEPDRKTWLHMDENEMNMVIDRVKDQNLKLTLSFGIGLHHAGLNENDRNTVEELFYHQKIQVLIATATLAWGVNLPAHLVVIKGTEYYDGKKKRYVDFPVTDVLQMMGRAGRPQFDDEAVAVIYVQDTKKPFYKKFLHEPFPVESSLLNALPDHLNAEIVAGTVSSKQEAMEYLTWTYFFRRLIKNPSYYNLEEVSSDSINTLLTVVVDAALQSLKLSGCVAVMEDNRSLNTLTLGQIASFYYLQHSTVKLFRNRLHSDCSVNELLRLLSDFKDVPEYDEIPVRHNEDQINADLAKSCPIQLDSSTMDDPHTKTHLLLQTHFSRFPMPISDYSTDLKSVMDQAIRILQAMLDVSAERGWLVGSLNTIRLIQMIVQGRWNTDSPISCLPHVTPYTCRMFGIELLPELKCMWKKNSEFILKKASGILGPSEVNDVERVLRDLPDVRVGLALRGWWEGENKEARKRIVSSDKSWIPVHGDQEYLLCIDLERLNKVSPQVVSAFLAQKRESRAYAPKFPKVKDEGWILVLGDRDTRELIALKRIGYIRRLSSANLLFSTGRAGRRIFSLFLMSDSYLGLDQRFDIPLEVLPSSLEAQVNAEVSVS